MMEAGEGEYKQVLQEPKGRTKDLVAFFFIGLFNHMSYCLMLAGAKEISNGGVGLTYICLMVPSLVMKVTGPYWFHLVSYKNRMLLCAILMSGAFTTVAYAVQTNSLAFKLIGVSLGGLQTGLGEASFLALATFYDTRKALTAWSSGTGASGIAGYSFKILMTDGFKLSFPTASYIANVITIGFVLVYLYLLGPPKEVAVENKTRMMQHMSMKERTTFILSLWPYMIPLGLVYFSEYAMQAGTWAAIGFPIHSKTARDSFYSYSNWLYQFGVFLSRSTGSYIQVNRTVFWAMPILQTVLLVFFIFVAFYQFWYDWGLLSLAFVAGLLGGAVYVNAFTLIASNVQAEYVELALSSASLADTLGIMFAVVTGLYLQCIIYQYHDVPGAMVSC